MPVPDASVVLTPGRWEHRMVAANGARFHVASSGDGPLVLFLHGFPECWWAWRSHLGPVAEAGYRAVAMDLRGYGASDKPPRGYDPTTLSADVAGVIRSLGVAQAVLVGHGLGGMLAWTTAVQHPRLVRRMCVLAAPHPRRLRTALVTDLRQVGAGRHVAGFQAPILPERRLVAADGAMVVRLLKAWGAAGWPDAEAAAYYRTAIAIPGVAHSSLEAWRWAVRSVPRPDGIRYHRSMRPPVRIPVLHLHGGADRAVLPSSAQSSSSYVRAPYRWQLLAGVGHFPHEEAPDRLTTELLGWLADREPDG